MEFQVIDLKHGQYVAPGCDIVRVVVKAKDLYKVQEDSPFDAIQEELVRLANSQGWPVGKFEDFTEYGPVRTIIDFSDTDPSDVVCKLTSYRTLNKTPVCDVCGNAGCQDHLAG